MTNNKSLQAFLKMYNENCYISAAFILEHQKDVLNVLIINKEGKEIKFKEEELKNRVFVDNKAKKFKRLKITEVKKQGSAINLLIKED